MSVENKKEVSFNELQEIIVNKKPLGFFWTKDLDGEEILIISGNFEISLERKYINFIGVDNCSGNPKTITSQYLEDLLNY